MDYVLDFEAIDRTHAAIVGGKGAHLGELSRIDGVRVPAGFCVTTAAYARIVADAASMDVLLGRLSKLEPDDHDAIRELSAEIRDTIGNVAIPDGVATAIERALARTGEEAAYAVRSSATAEDLPGASFAGQQDTYLNVMGPTAILEHVRRCWASLFTERAVTYRMRNGFDHGSVRMAVVVQRMVFPEASGVLFTADPVTGNRKVTSIEAVFGLGEALVSGVVNADAFRVRGDEVVARQIATKEVAVVASPDGGTVTQAIEPNRQNEPALTDAQVLRLAGLGRRIEAHFGAPQDIEWCLVDGEPYIVQSRPITTLFPIPETDAAGNRVYLSVGHQQMMTDAMKPLGLSVWQLTTPRPMAEAGGRLFVDATETLSSPAVRDGFIDAIARLDPLTGDALRTIVERGDFLPDAAEDAAEMPRSLAPQDPVETDPDIVTGFIEETRASIAALKRDIRGRSGPALLDFILADFQELKRLLFDRRSHQAIMTGMQAMWWLNGKLGEWLGERNVADTLAQSAPNNVTAEMGLALLDVADAIRPHTEVVEFLQHVEDDDFLDELRRLPGGTEARDAIEGWLELYGMRCVGEIDITRPRWSERPSTIVPMILSNIRNFAAGEAKRRWERGLREASEKERDVLERLRALPDGAEKAEETKRMIDRVRTFTGYREYPKYGMISRYFVYKRALLEEAARLVEAGVLREPDDIFFLGLQELHDVVRTHRVDARLIRDRRAAFRTYQTLTPPRVMTSDGEIVTGRYRREDVPAGALVGLPVSAGIVEGRARVILDMSQADLEPGDILVTTSTDPSWTPLFVTLGGLVTEVGGLMTHGAVIAREYGLPGVVGVEHATRLIPDGRPIRVDGAAGTVEILP